MGIGTSLGAFHENEFEHVAKDFMIADGDTIVDPSWPEERTQDHNVKDPDIMMYDNLLKSGVEKPIYNNNYQVADRDMQLTDQEKNLYRMHLFNLDQGGIRNDDGSISTLLQQTFTFDSSDTKDGEEPRVYNLPTVYNGKIHNPSEAATMANKLGLDNFPNYSSSADAQGRYDKMHQYMENDVMNYEEAHRRLQKPL